MPPCGQASREVWLGHRVLLGRARPVGAASPCF